MSLNSIYLGTLYDASLSLHHRMRSALSTPFASCFSTTIAFIRSPVASSGTPTTQAPTTVG